MRRIWADGWQLTLERWRLWPWILRTAPIHTASEGSAVEVHLMCCDRDYLCAIWALKTFYARSEARYPLFVHVQGWASPRMLRQLGEHFPSARIIVQEESDATIEPLLTGLGLHRLRIARQRNPMMMKLTDFALIGAASRILALDSDVLFFRRPAELCADAAPKTASLFMRDAGSNYAIAPEHAQRALGVRLAPDINTGLILFPRDNLRLDRCDAYLADAALQEHALSGLLEQTLHALSASQLGCVEYLPASYLLSTEGPVALESLVARHYAGLTRPWLTREGMPYAQIHSGLARQR